MKLGVPNQSAQGEKRVALVPDTAKKLAARGVETVVESGAGELSHIPDSAYTDAGATVGSARTPGAPRWWPWCAPPRPSRSAGSGAARC